MNVFQLSIRSLLSRPASTAVSLLLLTLGVAMISLLLLLNQQLEEKFQRNISGIDMVVGAKGSPLQLILSAVFQIDYPTGNIPLEEAQKLQRNRMVARAIPLAYGDSFQGFRIVGTEEAYLDLYEASLSKGKIWDEPFEVVLGSQVARETGLQLSDSFYSAHGLIAGADEHDEQSFRVAGILERTNSVLDGLILTNLQSIWAVHEHHEGEQEREITALLVSFRGPMGLVMMPRQINERTTMQAAVPSLEITKLFSLLGIGIDLLRTIGYGIILIAGLSFFLSLYNSLRERKYELALMRSMGGSRIKVSSLLILEGIILTISGYILGLVLGHAGLYLLSQFSAADYGYQFSILDITQEELWLGIVVVLTGLLAAFIPAAKVFRTSISDTLAGT